MFPYFLSYCLNTPWAMEPAAMALYASMLVKAYGRKSGVVADVEDTAPQGTVAKTSGAASRPAGNIALINVFGAIMQRAADFGPCENGTGCEDIGAALRAAEADETVSQILMRFSTPGGSVFGTQELGALIKGCSKPVVGIADSMAASAGYWLLAQCSEVYVTPGGMVGSIGVYTAHEDVSRAMEEQGVKVSFVSAGKYKVEGNPFEPLGDEARGEMQGRVDAYYRAFTQAVARGRNVPVEQVRTGMGEGRMLLAEDALKANMVDGVATFEQVVRKMQSRDRQSRGRLSSARADLAGL